MAVGMKSFQGEQRRWLLLGSLASLAWNWTELRGWRWQRENHVSCSREKISFSEGWPDAPGRGMGSPRYDDVSSPASSEAGKRWIGKPADVASPDTGSRCHLQVQCHGHVLTPVRSTSFLTAREHTKHFPLWPDQVFCAPALSFPVASLWSLKYLPCDYWRITLHSVSWEQGEKKSHLKFCCLNLS